MILVSSSRSFVETPPLQNLSDFFTKKKRKSRSAENCEQKNSVKLGSIAVFTDFEIDLAEEKSRTIFGFQKKTR